MSAVPTRWTVCSHCGVRQPGPEHAAHGLPVLIVTRADPQWAELSRAVL